MTIIKWESELRKTIKNDKQYYFIKCCDYWKRVTKKDYQERENDSIRSDCFQTIIKGEKITFLKIVYGVHYSKLHKGA